MGGPSALVQQAHAAADAACAEARLALGPSAVFVIASIELVMQYGRLDVGRMAEDGSMVVDMSGPCAAYKCPSLEQGWFNYDFGHFQHGMREDPKEVGQSPLITLEAPGQRMQVVRGRGALNARSQLQAFVGMLSGGRAPAQGADTAAPRFQSQECAPELAATC